MFLKIFQRLIHFSIAYLRVNIKSLIIKLRLILKKKVFIGRNVIIDPDYDWLISIGENSALTSGVTILAHDGSISRLTGYTKIGKVSIGSRTFIGVKSIILPGVNIGSNVIIGAGSVVTKDIPDNSVAFGNPAVVVCTIQEFIEKHQKSLTNSTVYENEERLLGNFDRIVTDFEGGIGYIRTDFRN
jgi:maltose O-acetyltransferase